jgi:hypothetical protein
VNFRFILLLSLLLFAWAANVRPSAAQGCPTDAHVIDTDRPDETNSPLVVPVGSFQVEDGVAWTAEDRSNVFDAAETRLRLGIAECLELVLDTPTYFYAIDGHAPSGFNDVVLSFKWQLPRFYGFTFAPAGGVTFPSGSHEISGRGYSPFLPGIVVARHSRRLGRRQHVHALLVHQLAPRKIPPSHPPSKFARSNSALVRRCFPRIRRRLSSALAADSQVIDAGATWQIARLQQVDSQFRVRPQLAPPRITSSASAIRFVSTICSERLARYAVVATITLPSGPRSERVRRSVSHHPEGRNRPIARNYQ